MLPILKLYERAKYSFYADWLDQNMFNRLVKLYPKFDRWIVETYVRLLKEYGEGSREVVLFWEDTDQLKEYLKLFEKAKNKRMLSSRESDLMRLKSVEELKDLVLPLKDELTDRDEEEYGGEAEKIYEKDGWLIVIPKDEEASCKYGANTQWCTASTKGNNFFQRYNQRGPLYIIIDKKSNRKWQFHPASDTYMDENDRSIRISDYIMNFPDHVKDALDDAGVAPWTREQLEWVSGIMTDAKNLSEKEFAQKYERDLGAYLEDMISEDLIDSEDIELGELLTPEAKNSLMMAIEEQILTSGYSYGYNNPDQFLDEDPKEEDEDGEPEWSEEQREKAALIAEDAERDEILAQEMNEITSESLANVRSWASNIANIVRDPDNWRSEPLFADLQAYLTQAASAEERFIIFLEEYGIGDF
jgi:hypothetical protein